MNNYIGSLLLLGSVFTQSKNLRHTIILLLFSIISVGTVYAAPVGKVTQLSGDAEVTRHVIVTNTLTLNDAIEQNDVLKTNPASSLEVTMVEGSIISMGENTIIDISNYVTDTGPTALLKQNSGRIRAFVVDLFSNRKDSFQIHTPTALVGVQGTDFEVHIEPDGTYVYVHSGVVSVRNILPTIPKELHLLKNEAAFVAPNQPPVRIDWPARLKSIEMKSAQTSVSKMATFAAEVGTKKLLSKAISNVLNVGFYAEASIGQSDLKNYSCGPGCDVDADTKHTFKTVKAGYRTNEYLDFDLAYVDLNTTTAHSVGTSSPISDSIKITGFASTVTGSYPVGKNVVGFVKTGLFRWSQEVDYSDVSFADSGSFSGTSKMIGFGSNIYYANWQGFGVHLEWNKYFDVGTDDPELGHKNDIEVFIVGTVFNFQL